MDTVQSPPRLNTKRPSLPDAACTGTPRRATTTTTSRQAESGPLAGLSPQRTHQCNRCCGLQYSDHPCTNCGSHGAGPHACSLPKRPRPGTTRSPGRQGWLSLPVCQHGQPAHTHTPTPAMHHHHPIDTPRNCPHPQTRKTNHPLSPQTPQTRQQQVWAPERCSHPRVNSSIMCGAA